METTIACRGYIGIMENKMETFIVIDIICMSTLGAFF